MTLKERYLYGSSRLGMNTDTVDMIVTHNPNFQQRHLGKKMYELNNHLGNVLAVVTDKKIPIQDGTTGMKSLYLADVVSVSDYYPFGAIMPGRNFNANSYRYSVQGHEKDDEIKGTGNSIDFGARMYDPRLGRFLTPDPLFKIYPWQSSYAYIRNNPIFFIDVNGEGDPLAKMQIRRNEASNLQGIVRNSGTKPHQGFDLAASPGTPILAVKDAEVFKVVHDEKAAYGNQITLKITNDKGEVRYAQYSHLSEANVKVGDKVTEGQEIGKTGTTGNAKGMTGADTHLHFEYRDEPSPGLGLGGRLDPNEVLDTKFYSQDPNATNQKNVGVIKVDKEGNATKMDPLSKGGKETPMKDFTPTQKTEEKK